MIKAVIFDFGNVICRFDNGIILAKFAEQTGRSVEELKAAVYDSSSLVADYEKGVVSSEEFYVRLSTRCNINLPWEVFVQLYTDKFTPIPDTFALIKRLKGRYKLGLLSNTSELDLEHGIKTTEVFPLFDAMTLSFQVHALKPAREVYADILAKLGSSPVESVYIDDIQVNVDGASAVGMHGIRFVTSERLANSLADLGIQG